jgi:hypothetical protein
MVVAVARGCVEVVAQLPDRQRLVAKERTEDPVHHDGIKLADFLWCILVLVGEFGGGDAKDALHPAHRAYPLQ